MSTPIYIPDIEPLIRMALVEATEKEVRHWVHNNIKPILEKEIGRQAQELTRSIDFRPCVEKAVTDYAKVLMMGMDFAGDDFIRLFGKRLEQIGNDLVSRGRIGP